MFCKKCGKEMGEAAYCPFCGAAQNPTQSQVQQPAQPVVVNVVNTNTNTNQNTNINGGGSSYPYKSKWTAFFLCLFLGMFGAHRFYVGKSGTGIIWLVTVVLGGVGWVIDLILILFGSFRDKAGYPLR